MCSLLLASGVVCTQNAEGINTDEPLLTTTFAIEDKLEVIEPSNAKPIVKPEVKPEEPTLTAVRYDQRQEGQYNFRADLDNFMIVLVPQNPLDGLNLDILDLLTKSVGKGSNLLKPNMNKKQLPSRVGPQRGEPNQQNFNFINRQPLISLLSGNQKKLSEFMERRTPYKVDLSSENNYNQIHENQRMEMPSSLYPMQSIF